MAYYNELTTVADLRAAYLNSTKSTQDALMLDMIRQACREIEEAANRRFVPRVQTRHFDAVANIEREQRRLWLDEDLLAVLTLTNGDGTLISSNQYVLESPDETPYWAIKLLASAGIAWTYEDDPENAILLNGIWGYHRQYSEAWGDVGAQLTGDINSTVTALSVTSGILKAGQLGKISDEFFYFSAASGVNATAVRGVNGSTPALHSAGSTIYVWDAGQHLEMLARRAAAAYFKLRENPIADTIVIDGQTFATPKDVLKWIGAQLDMLGLVRK